ncbi:hypothetical protein FF2_033479 [Malus domestica]
MWLQPNRRDGLKDLSAGDGGECGKLAEVEEELRLGALIVGGRHEVEDQGGRCGPGGRLRRRVARLCWTLVVIDGRISALAESNGIVSVVTWRSNESLSSAAPLSFEPETQKALNSSRQNAVIVVGVVIDHDAFEL